MKSILFGAALSVALATTSAAGAATIVTQTTRANIEAATGLSGGAVIDFESATPGYFNEVSQQGVTFSAPTGALGVDTQYAGQFSLIGKSLKSVSHKRIDMAFAEPITGFGFFFGASDLTWTLTAYDALGGVLETLLIGPTGTSNAGNFFGVTAAGIRSARLTAATPDWVAIDDFRTSTAPRAPSRGGPARATWAMMIFGFGATGALIRRSRERRFVAAVA